MRENISVTKSAVGDRVLLSVFTDTYTYTYNLQLGARVRLLAFGAAEHPAAQMVLYVGAGGQKTANAYNVNC